MQMTWSDDDDSSINEEEVIFSGFVVHDKKLRLQNSDDEISKSHDVSPLCGLWIISHNFFKASSDEQSISGAKSSYDDDVVIGVTNKACDHMHFEWIRMNGKCRNVNENLSKLLDALHEKKVTTKGI